jgi:hypothetical protein
MQALGAARFEASRFWSTVAAEDARLVAVAEAYRREALLLSRLATLYPYPAGGDVGNPNLRRLAGGMLRQATDVEREAVARLRAVELEPPDGSGG